MEPNASLGIQVDFPDETVRNALLFAMQMGTPKDDLRAKFVRRGEGIQFFHRSAPTVALDPATVAVDRDKKPLNPQIISRRAQDQVVSDVDVAIEITEVPPDELPVGNFAPTKATLTLMNEEFIKIDGCQEMTYNGERYGYFDSLEAVGLFVMTFHTLIYYKLGGAS